MQYAKRALRLGLHDRVEEVYMEGREEGGSMLTIKRYPALKILYLLSER